MLGCHTFYELLIRCCRSTERHDT